MSKKEKVLVKVAHSEQKVIPCKAPKNVNYQGIDIKADEAFYLSHSGSEDGYHIVRWQATTWVCSCGAGTKAHAHIRAVNAWIVSHKVLKQAAHQDVKRPSHTDVSTSGALSAPLNGNRAFSKLR